MTTSSDGFRRHLPLKGEGFFVRHTITARLPLEVESFSVRYAVAVRLPLGGEAVT